MCTYVPVPVLGTLYLVPFHVHTLCSVVLYVLHSKLIVCMYVPLYMDVDILLLLLALWVQYHCVVTIATYALSLQISLILNCLNYVSFLVWIFVSLCVCLCVLSV